MIYGQVPLKKFTVKCSRCEHDVLCSLEPTKEVNLGRLLDGFQYEEEIHKELICPSCSAKITVDVKLKLTLAYEADGMMNTSYQSSLDESESDDREPSLVPPKGGTSASIL